MALVKHPTLYKRDTKGKVRVWWVETDDDQYRVVSGLEDGKLVESDWKTATPKNVGRTNATTGPEQALREMDSLYEKQLNQGKYHESKDTIDEEGYFEPMLAEKWDDAKGKKVGIKVIQKAFDAGVNVYVQPKFDGIRNIATVHKMTSRVGEPRVSVPHIQRQVRDFVSGDEKVVLDGELYNHDYHDNFNKIQSLVLQHKPGPDDIAASAEQVDYYVYDAFFKDEPNLTFGQRAERLSRMDNGMNDNTPDIIFVQPTKVASFEEIDELYGRILEEGYEGIMIRIDEPYEPGCRSKSLIKRKEFFDEEFEIVDIIEGTGNWNGKAKAVKFKAHPGDDRSYDDLPKAGIRGDEAQMTELLRNKGKYIGGEVTVRFPNKTPGGDPRFGVAVAFYEGKRTS